MKRPSITLADFSQFTIQQVVDQSGRTLLHGRVTKPGRLFRGQHLSMFISLEAAIQGVLVEFNPDTANAVLDVVAENLHPAAVGGAIFPVYDSYWGRKLHLVLDVDIRWARMEFVAPDAFVEPSAPPGWRKWRIATPDDKMRTDG